ncbi:MAG: hypothetical protein GY778_12420, partial [bacterium]|nr:hypothetical protein [bacterium]
KTVVFLAVGFETTTPATGVVIRDAVRQGIDNFCILCSHKLVVPAMTALLSSKNDQIDAFLCPGHVSVIIGVDAYTEVVEGFGRPCVVAGFEAVRVRLKAGAAHVLAVVLEALPAKGVDGGVEAPDVLLGHLSKASSSAGPTPPSRNPPRRPHPPNSSFASGPGATAT